MKFPCELVVWKILPSIKSKLAQKLKDKGMKQKDIADVLNITEAAVSQYLSGKRAKDFKIPDTLDNMFDVVGEAISEGQNNQVLMYGICQICKQLRSQGEACATCRAEIGATPGCDLCMKNEDLGNNSNKKTE